MPVRPRGFMRVASIATLALLAVPTSSVHAQQIVLSNTRGLDFGRFVAGAGGTVVVGPTGVRSRTGAVVLLNSPNAGQAMFTAGRSGNGRKTMADITLPANGSIRLTSGANSMTVNNFVTPTTPLSVPSATTVSVGATLVVAPNQAPGTYSGTFSVTVNYQ